MTTSRKGGSKEIGRMVRALRKMHGLTATELAYKSGLSAGTVLNIEQGSARVTDNSLVKLARGLGKSVDWLDAKLNGNRR